MMNSYKLSLSDLESLSLSSIMETETGKFLSEQEFKDAILVRQGEFKNKLRLKAGEAAIILKANSISFFVDFFALLLMDVLIVPLDPGIDHRELDVIIRDTTPRVILRDESDELLNGEHCKNFSTYGLLLFTSGSTSRPKGVLISKAALEEKMTVLSNEIPGADIENTLCFVPTFFGHGLICNSLFPILFGKSFYISKKMSIEYAEVFLETLDKYQISFFSSVPSHWEMILSFSKKYLGKSLRRINCASAPLKKEKFERMLDWASGVQIYDTYGATEMLGWFAAELVTPERVSSVFKNFWSARYEVAGNGELILSSKYMCTGYYVNGNCNFITEFLTGDLFNSEMQLIGRSKGVINKNGIKIVSEDLDDELMESRMLSFCKTFPIEDRFSGEKIGVFLQMIKGVEVDSFKKYCTQNIPALRCPSEFILIDEIPMNSRGKIDYSELFKRYAGEYRK